MGSEIYLIQNDDQLIQMKETPYESEDLLQKLLSNYPNLLAGNQIDVVEPRRWLLVSREMFVPNEESSLGRWSLDHLFLDQDGIPTLVEVKRSCDTRIRREVVGQMLDYAANGVIYWSSEKIRAKFAANCHSQGQDPEQVLDDFLKINCDQERFWEKVETNLQLGKIRMVFVSDSIPPELQRIIEFLNAQMNLAEVLAVEIKQYLGQGLRTLVPRVVGQTIEAKQKKTSNSSEIRQWDEQSFFSQLNLRGSEEAEVAKRILNWAVEQPLQIRWGRGSYDGSFMPRANCDGKERSLFRVWTNGAIDGFPQTQLFHLDPRWLQFQKTVGDELHAINLSNIPTFSSVSIPIVALSKQTIFNNFLEVIDWMRHDRRIWQDLY